MNNLQAAQTATFICAFTGQPFSFNLPTTGAYASLHQPLSLHPVLQAQLSRAQLLSLPSLWQAYRNLWALREAGFIRWKLGKHASFNLDCMPPATLQHLLEDSAWLLRQHEARTSSTLQAWNATNASKLQQATLSSLPRFTPQGAEAAGLGCAAWLKQCRAKLAQDASAPDAGLDADQLEKWFAEQDTSKQRIERMQEAVSSGIARKLAASVELEPAIKHVASILQDLADAHKSAGWKLKAGADAQPCGWTSLHTDWLASLLNPTKRSKEARKQGCAPAAMLRCCRIAIATYMPDVRFVGQKAALEAQLVLQALDAEILKQAQATIAMLDMGDGATYSKQDEEALAEANELESATLQDALGSAPREDGKLQALASVPAVATGKTGKAVAASLNSALKQATQAQPAPEAKPAGLAGLSLGALFARKAK